MLRMWSVALTLSIVVAPSVAQAQGAPPIGAPRAGLPRRDNAPATTNPASGRIRGRVVAADTSAPIRRAQILLTSGQLGVRRITTSDAEGRYEFSEVADGRYVITASKGSYVTLQYGQRRAFEPGTPLAVAVGQDVSQVDFALPRGSVITGRITDEFGEPVAGAFVEVQRYQYGPNGQRQLTFGGGTGLVVTNDLGEFRAYGLMPGEYVVKGTFRQATSAQGSNANDVTDGFVPTFYPGTANVAEAELVRVELAQETPIQIALLSGRLARVTGVVVDSMGKPVSGVRVAARTSSGEASITTTGISTTASDGSFSIANVSPGEHYLDVAGEPSGGRAAEAASVPLTVANRDITDLRVITGPPATVTGTVNFEGDSPRRGVLSGLAIVARPADMTQGPLFFSFGEDGRVDEAGRFRLQTLGDVFFRAINLGPWTLKQITLNGKDLTDEAYSLRLSETVQGLRVVLTDRATDVAGDVVDARGQPIKDFVAVIQPSREMEPIGLQRFLQAARPDQDGHFRSRALPTGEYVATAVEALEQGREWDPEYRRKLRDAGERFSITEGQSLTLSLELASGL